jgi:hypothetical protein
MIGWAAHRDRGVLLAKVDELTEEVVCARAAIGAALADFETGQVDTGTYQALRVAADRIDDGSAA